MSELRVDNIVSQDGTAAPVYSQGVIVGSGKTFTVRGNVEFQSGANVSGAVTFSSVNFATGFNVTGVVTATSFSGNATGLTGTPNIVVGSVTGSSANFSGNVSVGGTLTYEDVTNIDSVGLVTARTGVRVTAGGIVVNSGVTTLTTLIPDETRFKSVAEEIKVGTATSVTINFSAGEGNIGIVRSPSGPISLYVNNIPTTNFSNKVISLTVIINQGSTGYACSSIFFNGTQRTIRWASGTVSAGNTSCIDYYNFVGIDTVGDGAITSYTVTGSANGNYRFY